MTLYNSVLRSTHTMFLRTIRSGYLSNTENHAKQTKRPTTSQAPALQPLRRRCLEDDTRCFPASSSISSTTPDRRSFNETKHLDLRVQPTKYLPSTPPSSSSSSRGRASEDQTMDPAATTAGYVPFTPLTRSRSRSVVCRWMIVRDELVYSDPMPCPAMRQAVPSAAHSFSRHPINRAEQSGRIHPCRIGRTGLSLLSR
jgi:hypothetical protein